MVLLLPVMVHAGEAPGDAAGVHETFRAVENRLIRDGLPQADARATVQAMAGAHFTREQMVRAAEQMTEGNYPGRTTWAVREKIHEGIAKRVPPETILAASAKVRDRYGFAEKMAVKLKQPDLAETYADCLAAGMSKQDAQKLTGALLAGSRRLGTIDGPRLAAETLITARDMVRQGISSRTTSEVLGAALRKGYSKEGMRTIRHTLAGDTRDNMERSARQLGAAIDHGVQAGELSGISGHGADIGHQAGMGEGTAGSDSGHSGSGGDGGGGPGGSGGDGGGGGGSGGGSGGGGGNH